jgi:dUTP pyrophosphatase
MHFEKVSFEQFAKDVCDIYRVPEGTHAEAAGALREYYDGIKLPRRATIGSAGYDFCTPIPVNIGAGESLVIPTGIRCVGMPRDIVLVCAPRSGLGFKYGLRLSNTLGIIDSDYAHANNEGHIMAKLITDVDIHLNPGERFMQGIFLKYFTTDDDASISESRTGGIGSTGLAG